MNGIYWLASYPKSGNTWFRIFLANLLSDKDEPVDINNMGIRNTIASNRGMFDELIGYDSSDLTMDEIDSLRPDLYSLFAKIDDNIKYLKIHDAYTKLNDGRNIIPNDGTLGALYIIRNPLDVAVSFANHSQITIEKSVDRMCEADFSFCRKDDVMSIQLRQKLLSWSGHVKSWTEQTDMKVHVIRYEDMKKKPYETFKSSIEFLGLNDKLDKLERAIGFSDFKIVKKQEEENGFIEKPVKAESFFREGETASWKKYLNKEQINKIIENHKEVMIKFGYLTKDDEIIE
ncbi:MAG: sulfotransferase domain-containing protein [Ignavibacteria bacterium]|jgi:hypothetical protein